MASKHTVRAGLTMMALAAAMLLIAAPALADSTVIVDPTNHQGWSIEPYPTAGSVEWEFEAVPATSGAGSLQFGPISGAPPANKMIIVRREAYSADEFESIAYDFYVDPAAANKNHKHYFLNLFVDSAANGLGTTASWYDCRFDFVPAASTATGWTTFSIDDATTASAVERPLASCPATVGELPSGSVIFQVSLNGGDTSASDAGLEGGWDTVVFTFDGNATTYDFEPAAVTPESKDDCKNGGWQDVTRADHTTFRNQGDCIQSDNTSN